VGREGVKFSALTVCGMLPCFSPECSDNAKQEHSPLGKVGAAVLGNAEAGKFQLLLYYNKKQQVCSVNIGSKFSFFVLLPPLLGQGHKRTAFANLRSPAFTSCVGGGVLLGGCFWLCETMHPLPSSNDVACGTRSKKTCTATSLTPTPATGP